MRDETISRVALVWRSVPTLKGSCVPLDMCESGTMGRVCLLAVLFVEHLYQQSRVDMVVKKGNMSRNSPSNCRRSRVHGD